jgi:DNA-binding FadR family transcriptional regulator
VVEAAHNPVLSAVAGPLLAVTRPKVMLKSAKLRDWQQSNAAHGRIVKLIADQDVDGAAAVMRRHLCGVSEYVRS